LKKMSFTFRKIGSSEFKSMPWKNGQGTTTEIAIYPDNANLSAFQWRLSSASMSASGPFSSFAGYERLLVVLPGAPNQSLVTLSHTNKGSSDAPHSALLPVMQPYWFCGDWQTTCELSKAPTAEALSTVHDFNVIWSSASYTAHVETISLQSRALFGETTGSKSSSEQKQPQNSLASSQAFSYAISMRGSDSSAKAASTVFLYCASGSATISSQSLGSQAVELTTKDVLRVDCKDKQESDRPGDKTASNVGLNLTVAAGPAGVSLILVHLAPKTA
jgi:environmental stress-induced protein Ves